MSNDDDDSVGKGSFCLSVFGEEHARIRISKVVSFTGKRLHIIYVCVSACVRVRGRGHKSSDSMLFPVLPRVYLEITTDGVVRPPRTVNGDSSAVEGG
jgi:hypothetical protein